MRRLAWPLLLLLAPTCAGDEQQRANLGGDCFIDSDCAGDLACVFRRCHERCTETKDCPAGSLCVQGQAGQQVCQLDDETDCGYHSDCPTGQLCAVDLRCRDECRADRDCLPGQLCVAYTCAEPDEQLEPVGTEEGTPCAYNSDCTEPLRCIGGQCLYECKQDVDCASGACVDNLCQLLECVPNHQIACQCPLGTPGVRLCGPDGSYGPCDYCDCDDPVPVGAVGADVVTLGGLALHSSGDLFIGGSFATVATAAPIFGGAPLLGAGGRDAFLVRRGPDGSAASGFELSFGSAMLDEIHDIALDAAQDVVVVGVNEDVISFGGAPVAGPGMFMAKLTDTGAHVFSQGVTGFIGQVHVAIAAGDIIVAGTFDGSVDFGGGPLSSAGLDDVFIASYSSAGVHQWSARYGDFAPQTLLDLATDAAGNIHVAGILDGTMDFGGTPISSDTNSFEKAYVAKLDSAGNHVWSAAFCEGLAMCGATSLAVDGGDLLVGGFFGDSVDFGGGPLTAGGESAFVARFDPAGAHVSSAAIGDGTQATAVAAAADGGAYVAGSYAVDGLIGVCMLPPLPPTPGHSNAFFAEVAANGSSLYATGFGDTTQSSLVPQLLHNDIDGSVALLLQTEGLAGTVGFGGVQYVGSGYLAIYPP